MLKHNEVNPLTVFGLRRIEHCPPHFVQVGFNLYCQEKAITDWIWENLTGRFFFGDHYTLIDSTIVLQKTVGFEIASEASYFSLVLDTINKQG
jgi:hypothetical protein